MLAGGIPRAAQLSRTPPAKGGGRDEVGLFRGLPEAALREAPVALPSLEPERLLLPPHHRDDVKADALPAATDQQRELHSIFLQIFSGEVT